MEIIDKISGFVLAIMLFYIVLRVFYSIALAFWDGLEEICNYPEDRKNWKNSRNKKEKDQ